MKKTKKIDVITVKLICHIPVDTGDDESQQNVAGHVKALRELAEGLGETTVEKRLNRVSAPEPAPEVTEPTPEPAATEPADDGLDIPNNLRRVPKHEPVADAQDPDPEPARWPGEPKSEPAAAE